MTFRTSAKSSVPEGTPLNIQWRASGAKPELTPNLEYSWELQDWTHTKPGMLGPQPTIVQNACAYAAQPCASGWFGSQSESQVTFNGLPAARYELHLTVRPTVPAPVQSNATQAFEIAPNQLVELTVNPGTVRPGQTSTATIVLEGPAVPRGKLIHLMSSNPELVSLPPSIVIPGGATTGTVALRAAPASLGQVTITASLTEFLALQGAQAELKTNLTTGVLSRGVEGTEQPTVPAEELQTTPDNETRSVAGEPSLSDIPDPSQDVMERGIQGMVARPSTSFAQAKQLTAVAPNPQSAGAITQKSPGIAAALALPSARKQTILTIQPDIQIQQNLLIQPNLKRFQTP